MRRTTEKLLARLQSDLEHGCCGRVVFLASDDSSYTTGTELFRPRIAEGGATKNCSSPPHFLVPSALDSRTHLQPFLFSFLNSRTVTDALAGVLVPDKVDISTPVDRLSKDRRHNPSAAALETMRLL